MDYTICSDNEKEKNLIMFYRNNKEIYRGHGYLSKEAILQIMEKNCQDKQQ